LNRKR